jgi:hypothetical protein
MTVVLSTAYACSSKFRKLGESAISGEGEFLVVHVRPEACGIIIAGGNSDDSLFMVQLAQRVHQSRDRLPYAIPFGQDEVREMDIVAYRRARLRARLNGLAARHIAAR